MASYVSSGRESGGWTESNGSSRAVESSMNAMVDCSNFSEYAASGKFSKSSMIIEALPIDTGQFA